MKDDFFDVKGRESEDFQSLVRVFADLLWIEICEDPKNPFSVDKELFLNFRLRSLPR